MDYNKTPDRGASIYLNSCNCEGVLDELLQTETTCEHEKWRVAMAYVPMQPWEETYSPAKALKRGTIFPSLDLPFKGGGRL